MLRVYHNKVNMVHYSKNNPPTVMSLISLIMFVFPVLGLLYSVRSDSSLHIDEFVAQSFPVLAGDLGKL